MLKLHYHPLASFCWKVQIALDEAGIEAEYRLVDLFDPEDSAELRAAWPVGLIPVLQDGDRMIPETTIIIEHLAITRDGARMLLPGDAAAQLDVRLWDRFFDLYVQVPMQAIVGDRLKDATKRDPEAVAAAEGRLDTAWEMLDARMRSRDWAAGDGFTMADCAAAPALFYASLLRPYPDGAEALAAYHERLIARPSVARAIEHAKPWFAHFPFADRLPEHLRGAA